MPSTAGEKDQMTDENEIILDLRDDSPDLDVCALAECRLPRYVHPLNLTDRDALGHYFTTAEELHHARV